MGDLTMIVTAKPHRYKTGDEFVWHSEKDEKSREILLVTDVLSPTVLWGRLLEKTRSKMEAFDRLGDLVGPILAGKHGESAVDGMLSRRRKT